MGESVAYQYYYILFVVLIIIIIIICLIKSLNIFLYTDYKHSLTHTHSHVSPITHRLIRSNLPIVIPYYTTLDLQTDTSWIIKRGSYSGGVCSHV